MENLVLRFCCVQLAPSVVLAINMSPSTPAKKAVVSLAYDLSSPFCYVALVTLVRYVLPFLILAAS